MKTMTKLPKFFLTISLTAFAVGFATASSSHIAPAWAVAMPIGAMCLGWFLIAFTLQNEVARFDEETRVHSELVKRHASAKRPVAEIRSERVPVSGAFSAANSH